MPSGLLDGKGCRDSIRKSERDSDLFLSIRHHSMPFIIDEREAKVKLNGEGSHNSNSLDARVKEQFVSGALPVLSTISKFISLVFVFPFHFLFQQLPELITDAIIVPLASIVKKIYERVMTPCRKVFYSIYNPLVAFYEKFKTIFQNAVNKIKVPYLKLCSQVLAILQKVHVAVVMPVKGFIQKGNNLIAGFGQQINYKFLVSKIWIKLLIEHSVNSVPRIGKKKQP